MSETFDGSKADKYIADEFGQTGKLHFKSTKAIEFERYKQDCRKRALDLAHSEAMRETSSNPLSQRQATIPAAETTTAKADKYYNWLINIPQ